MGKVESYRRVLWELEDWDDYLLKESNLPGPRANLELAFAVAMEGDEALFRRYSNYDPIEAPTNSKEGFLVVCGVMGLGYSLESEREDIIDRLRIAASDPRWRVREAVALGLQHYGRENIEDLLVIMSTWSEGNPLERRAVVATLCEPDLLKEEEPASKTINLMDRITESILAEKDRRADDFKTLRKGLAYGWSVAVAGQPAIGKAYMERWILSKDRDIHWIMKQNLKKKRLSRMDPDWVSDQLTRLDG